MRLMDHAPNVTNPYPVPPEPPVPSDHYEIDGVTFETGLLVARLKNAPQMAKDEDALYINGSDYVVRYRLNGQGREVVVPRGMLTDLTSVPWFARWIVARVGKHLEAAVVHDFLYIAWQDLPGRGARPEDRAFADALMLAIMDAAGVWKWRARLIYMVVRWFGARAYENWDATRYLDMDAPEVLAQFPGKNPLQAAIA